MNSTVHMPYNLKKSSNWSVVLQFEGLSVRLIIWDTGISRYELWYFQRANAPHFTQKPHHVCHAQSSIKQQQRAGLCSK
jgi:hypothetical protein